MSTPQEPVAMLRAGDLNYRLDIERKECLELIQNHRWEKLQEYDQLLKVSRGRFGAQGSTLARAVAGFQGSRVPRFQGSNDAFFLTQLPAKRLNPNRTVVGKFLRLRWELHLHFPDVRTLWTMKTQQMQHYPGMLPKFGEQMLRNLVNVQQWFGTSIGRQSGIVF